jgi:hypothetical protein
MNYFRFFRSLSVLAAACGFGSAGAFAQTASTSTVTSVTTFTSMGSSFSDTVPGAGSGGFPTGSDYEISYSGEASQISGFTTGTGPSTVNYVPLAYAGTISTTLVRYPSSLGTNQNNNIVYQRVLAQSGTDYTLAGPYQPNEQALFNANNLNAGTDNLFGNTGDGNGNNNDVERVDVVFSDGLTATSSLAFLVLERGVSTAHDGFGIAAITGVDGSGTPTAFGELILFSSGSYGTTDLLPSSTDWLVLRNNASVPDGGAISPSSDISNQAIGGTTVAVTASTGNSGLGITLGSTIYGYSLFAYDTSVTTPSQLLEISNDTYFPKNTSSNTGAGGIDLIAYTGVAVQAVPEPSTTWLVGLGALAFLRRRRS